MPQVIVEFGRSMAPQPGRSTDAPVYDPFPQVEEVTSSGTSQATTIAAKAHDVAAIMNAGTTPVWAAFGTSPTAAVGSGVFIPANTVRDFGPIGAGMKAAIIDDS